jgi:hypothetical protein
MRLTSRSERMSLTAISMNSRFHVQPPVLLLLTRSRSSVDSNRTAAFEMSALGNESRFADTDLVHLVKMPNQVAGALCVSCSSSSERVVLLWVRCAATALEIGKRWFEVST